MKARINSAYCYLKELERSTKVGWLEYFNSEAKTAFSKLALLHPDHLHNLDLPPHRNIESIQRSIQGPRTFSSSIYGCVCQSTLVWEYACELTGAIQQDHLFPYSLGGPTLGANRIYLCQYHNMVKSSDIHCYPWEAVDTWTRSWLDVQLDRLHREVFTLYK
jgi:hypothetical protein